MTGFMPDRPAKPREYLIVHWVKGALFSHHNLQCGIKSDVSDVGAAMATSSVQKLMN